MARIRILGLLRLLFVLFVLALVVLLGVMLYKTFRYKSRQLQVAPAADVSLDANAAAEHLAQAVRFQTVSYSDPAQIKTDEFTNLRSFLEQTYPRTHATLAHEVVAGYSLLYKWQGQDQSLKPILLMGHIDVVPVEPGTEGQ
ncbi:MAG TPA: hypothetical protein VE821_12110, partial [Pyrinomonadaceae bacterium]|nr:hypothetical protein [Pyrinomonadaceae bacterium]